MANVTVRDAIERAEAEGRPDLAALYERTGWTRATPTVRRTLEDLADRHDLTGYAWAAERIREAPEGGRPSAVLRYVLDRDAEYRAEAEAEADARERQAAERQPSAPEAAARWAELEAEVRSWRAAPLAPDPSSPDRARRVARWRSLIAGREVPAVAARRAIAEYAPDLDDLAELAATLS